MLRQSPSRAKRDTRSPLASNLHDLAVLAIPSEFRPVNRIGKSPDDEWMAVLPDSTKIVVADVEGKPSPIGIEKAVSIVQSRAYLEARARQLLLPLIPKDGQWRVVAIDFGIEAQHHDCEFLMCFALQATKADIGTASPYIEVGFALPMQSSIAPMFILMIETAIGLAR
jgi:hypothetical protein